MFNIMEGVRTRGAITVAGRCRGLITREGIIVIVTDSMTPSVATFSTYYSIFAPENKGQFQDISLFRSIYVLQRKS